MSHVPRPICGDLGQPQARRLLTRGQHSCVRPSTTCGSMELVRASELRVALRAAVVLALPEGGLVLSGGFGAGKVPTLGRIDFLRARGFFHPADEQLILGDISGSTSFERAEYDPALWEPSSGPLDCLQTISELARAWDVDIAPSSQAVATRCGHFRNWRSVVTWALAHGCTGSVLPMSLETCKAMSYELILLGCSASHVADVWSAVADRHFRAGVPGPLAAAGTRGAMLKAIASLQGHRLPLKLPISADMLKAILGAEARTLMEMRDKILAGVATTCCLRPSEVVALQVCDVWFDYDQETAPPGDTRFRGTLALNIKVRKQDQERKGHHPRIGRASDARYDLVFMLEAFLRVAGLQMAPGCEKRRFPARKCGKCPPLFPKLSTRNGGTVATDQCMRRQAVGDALKGCLQRLGIPTVSFSAVSARKGGISNAIENGVPEVVLFMQSGHAQSLAARRYVDLHSSLLLYDTWGAFWL